MGKDAPRRFRFGLRTLFVVVTVVAVIVTVGWRIKLRGDAYRKTAGEHWKHAARAKAVYRDAAGPVVAYHRSMGEKYDYAAEHPWLSVEPDPPTPAPFPD